MDDALFAYVAGLYRSYRKMMQPERALRMLVTHLWSDAAHMHSHDLHESEREYALAANWAAGMAALAELRSGASTARERFWASGHLSRPNDHLVFCEDTAGDVYWVARCPNISCAIKHGLSLLRQSQWQQFRVERRDGSVIVDAVTRQTTMAELMARLAGS